MKLVAATWLCSLLLCLASEMPMEEPIPPLRPPRPELLPGFWEQNGFWVLAGAMVGSTVLTVLALLLSRPRQAAEVAPAVRARADLQALNEQTEAAEVLSRVSKTLKGYFQAALGLPRLELTTAEFCREVTCDERIGNELGGLVARFLRDCDERKFAPHPANEPFPAVGEALQIVDAAEARLAERQGAPQKEQSA